MVYTTIMELGPPQKLNKDGLSGPNSILVVYVHPLGSSIETEVGHIWKMMEDGRGSF